MTDHADHFPMTKPFDLEDVTVALHNIADAIRGLTPNATQDAAGCPLIDPQPADGRTGGNDAEAGEPRFKPGGYVTSPWVEQNLRDRAERAERERDAILADLRKLMTQWNEIPTTSHEAISIVIRLTTQLGSILDCHTPEG